jgi:hypothetical protein
MSLEHLGYKVKIKPSTTTAPTHILAAIKKCSECITTLEDAWYGRSDSVSLNTVMNLSVKLSTLRYAIEENYTSDTIRKSILKLIEIDIKKARSPVNASTELKEKIEKQKMEYLNNLNIIKSYYIQ